LLKLRPYQEQILEQVRKSYSQYKRPCIVSPCGSGKSVLIAEIAKGASLKKNRVLFLVHRKELFEQIENTFKWWGVDMDYVHVAMVQTVVRRLDKTPEPKVIITDESHHAPANSYRKIYKHFPDAMLIGFTATPVRLNGGGLGEINDNLVIGPTVKKLIEWGNLSPFKYYAPVIVDTSKLRVRRGEYIQEDIEQMFENKAIWGDVVAHYKKLSEGKKAICYCSSVNQSVKMAEEFNNAGIPAQHVDGETSKPERKQAMDGFRSGRILILCNCELFGEGIDISDCNTVILLRPTQSLSLYIQQSMRCMRYRAGKTAIIIDHVGNVGRFGLPDAEREWTLEPKKKSNMVMSMNPVKQCPDCYYTVESAVAVCPECDFEFRQEQEDPLQIDSELIEINEIPVFTVDYRNPEDCRTLAELYQLAAHKNYKKGWAWFQAKRLGIYK